MPKTWFTTREAAQLLEVPSWYIRGEIRCGRLKAERIEREPLPGKTRAHPSIRIYIEDFAPYVQRYWPRFVERLTSAA
jgi:hypothetical protein